MNIYEKAVAGLTLAGHDANVIQQSAEDIGVGECVESRLARRTLLPHPRRRGYLVGRILQRTTKRKAMTLTLGENQVAVLDYSTRKVAVVTFDDINAVDVEESLYELGYEVANCAWMT